MHGYEAVRVEHAAAWGDAEQRRRDRHATKNNKEAMADRLLLPPNTRDLLLGRWRTSAVIAEGGFGQIYRAVSVDADSAAPDVAVKAEAVDAHLPLLQVETAALLQLPRSPHLPRFVGCGKTPVANYMVMELCGRSVRQLKKSTPLDRFSASTSLRLARQMVRALGHVHDAGWLHRDVKPSNFCVDVAERGAPLLLIDFGLARVYTLPDGRTKPARPHSGFHGTTRYASLTTHRCQDMGRRDDLWPVFYMVVEQLVGQLPWRQILDKPNVQALKEKTDFNALLAGWQGGDAALVLRRHLDQLNFAGRPDYDGIERQFNRALQRLGVTDSDPMDWHAPTSPPFDRTPPVGSSVEQLVSPNAASP